MAKQTSFITFTGKLGNLIGYRRNGAYCLRSMPVNVRQTAATRRAAQRFGRASKRAALIRNAFSGKMNVNCDSGHINRLTSALIPSAGRDISSITGSRFNQHTGTDKFFALAPRLSPDGILYIPPQTLPACKGINALEIKVIATRIHFATNQITGTESAAFIVKTGEPFDEAACNVEVPGKGTLVVVLQIRGLLDNIPSHNAKYMAADIIAVLPPPSRQILHKPVRQQRPVLRPALGNLIITAAVQLLPATIQRE
ncbi:MAG TPA: hypothetical protein VM802_00975 [Chitinophaga sp.]|uniref:hypothetical protein n=1 Tax=Chitinophaga sp. TaxID=1869181 RepID=UPI002BD4115C|nr:hypothetical protein [Chitinophaga sp.]HVI43404.1 hypothetical protein [Chitinophaga sp.]